MLEKLHITTKQWKTIIKWTLHTVLFLFVMLFQTVCLGNVRFFGVSCNFLPVLLTCVCIMEEPSSGGLFTLIMTLIWCLSGADFGSLSIVVLTVGGIFAGIICRAIINRRFLPSALCCFAVCFIHENAIFVLKLLFGDVEHSFWLTRALPSAVFAMVSFPLLYLIIKRISRIGGSNGV